MTAVPAIRADGVRHTFGDVVALDGLDRDPGRPGLPAGVGRDLGGARLVQRADLVLA